jgi:hypothetical protein
MYINSQNMYFVDDFYIFLSVPLTIIYIDYTCIILIFLLSASTVKDPCTLIYHKNTFLKNHKTQPLSIYCT